MNDEQTEDSRKVIDAARALSEHFDAVHIFASRHESEQKNGTGHWQVGFGNWFTRFGQIDMWVTAEKEKTRELMRMEVRKDEE